VKAKPPKWQRFDAWVWIGAGVGIVIAFALFCGVQLLVNGTKFFFDFTGAEKTPLSDIISMTATAIGGLAIGGVAVMQYRKHKWAEYQAKMDVDSKTGERLNKAIDHWGDKNDDVRLCALHEFRRLAEDSPSDRDAVLVIIYRFLCKQSEKVDLTDQLIVEAVICLNDIIQTDIEQNKKEKFIICKISYLLSDLASKSNKKLQLGLHHLKAKNMLFTNICFMDADLVYSDMEGSTFLSAIFPRANLYGANLKKTSFYAPSFIQTNMQSVHFEKAFLVSADLREADLKYAYFRGADLYGAHLEGADLRGAHFWGVKDLNKAHIDDKTRFDPGVRLKYFGVEEPEHD